MGTVFRPGLPNGTITNGVAHFVQPEINGTGPTTRVGGSPLVIGDKWYNTTRRSDWIWGGTYWQGEKREHGPLRSTNLSASLTNEFIIYPSNPNNLSRLLISFYSYGSGNPSAHNINNHYARSGPVGGYSTTYVNTTYNSITGWDFPSGNSTAGVFKNGSFNNLINFNLNSNMDRVIIALQSVTRVGSPPTMNFYNTWITIQDVL